MVKFYFNLLITLVVDSYTVTMYFNLMGVSSIVGEASNTYLILIST